jgi:hypothetical protein
MDPIWNQALMQDSVPVQPFARTKHGSNFGPGPYAGLCVLPGLNLDSPLSGLNMDPTWSQTLMQDFVHVQPFARTKHGSNFERNPYAGLCACSALCQD